MKSTHPSDPLRAKLLEHCEELITRSQAMRNYAMKPGNAWLARGELGSVQATLYEIETLLDEIKQSDLIA
jgi:hypothetical protein